MLLNSTEWNPNELKSPNQHLIPADKHLNSNIPFTPALPLVVKIPLGQGAKNDLYIDDNAGVNLDDPDDEQNENRITKARAAVPLAIHVTARPITENEPIPREEMLSLTKLLAEAGLEEICTLLGWILNTRELLVQLPPNSEEELETLIGRLTHIGFMLPTLYHFLSRL